jgi:hypothetical protein
MTTVNILRMPFGMNDDDDMNTGFISPYDRLELIETCLGNMTWQFEQHSQQVTEHYDLLVKISQTLKFLSSSNSSLHQQNQSLHHRIKTLEAKLNEK